MSAVVEDVDEDSAGRAEALARRSAEALEASTGQEKASKY
jgi:hypothetical protein